MPSRRALRGLLEFMRSDQDLGGALDAAGLRVSGTKSQRITELLDSVFANEIDFVDDVLAFGLRAQLSSMCEHLDLEPRGKTSDAYLDALDEWFQEAFPALSQPESTRSPLDGDLEFTTHFRTQEYANEFRLQMQTPPAAHRESRPYQAEAVRKLRSALNPDVPQVLHVATGGGKTWIANDILTQTLEERGGWGLWVTKDWRLLWQAARDISRRHDKYRRQLRRLGGDGSVLHPMPEGRDERGVVVYSTLHTLARRLQDEAKVFSRLPTMVVWDECHWGEAGKVGRALLKYCRGRAPLLGLTATPRRPAVSRFDQPAFSIGFAELVAKRHLASPVSVEPLQTGVNWRPRRAGDHFDFQIDSLGQLAHSSVRNKLIVEEYVRNAAKYGKTLVFACNIEHCDRLAALFNDAGIDARPVHSAQPESFNQQVLGEFESGKLRVLVNVAKLTHGVDVPDMKTVFLCRPTLSDILFSQMIGRASRRHEPSGKTSFFIVEFTDNLERFADQLVTSQRFFEGSGLGVAPEVPERGQGGHVRRTAHSFDIDGAWSTFPDVADMPEALRGLPYRHGQTFGIELELTSDKFSDKLSDEQWMAVATELRNELETALGPDRVAVAPLPAYGAADKTHDVWNVERDNSAGWEVTSRVLEGQAGFREVAEACDSLGRAATTLGLRANFRTGAHVHLGWRGRTHQDLVRAIVLAHIFEPALATLVAPSRIAHWTGSGYRINEPNEYCRPVSTVFTSTALRAAQSLADVFALGSVEAGRYLTFNVLPIGDLHTVEVRLHSGTTEATKVLTWISLWQQLLAAAYRDEELPELPDRSAIIPTDDVVELANRYLPGLPPAMLRRLIARRAEVVRLWTQHPELEAWLANARRWPSFRWKAMCGGPSCSHWLYSPFPRQCKECGADVNAEALSWDMV